MIAERMFSTIKAAEEVNATMDSRNRCSGSTFSTVAEEDGEEGVEELILFISARILEQYKNDTFYHLKVDTCVTIIEY